jgi:hypothetical protein
MNETQDTVKRYISVVSFVIGYFQAAFSPSDDYTPPTVGGDICIRIRIGKV